MFDEFRAIIEVHDLTGAESNQPHSRPITVLEELLEAAVRHGSEAYESFLSSALAVALESVDGGSDAHFNNIGSSVAREAIEQLLGKKNPSYPPEVVAALALAAHPWREDVPADVVAAEMQVAHRIASESPYDVASDRLLRLADACGDVASHAVEAYSEAARVIIDAAPKPPSARTSDPDDPLSALDAIIDDPWGVEGRATANRMSWSLAPPPSPLAEAAVRLLLAAAVRASSPDLGVALGGKPSSVSVYDVIRELGCMTPVDRLEEALGKLDSRGRDLARSRLLAAPGHRATLAELAEKWGLTRERIRQLCNDLEQRIAETDIPGVIAELADLVRASLPVITRTSALRDKMLVIAAADTSRADLIFGASGPWVVDDEWTWHQDDDAPIREVLKALRNSADEFALVPSTAIQQARDVNIVEPDSFDAFLQSQGFCRVGDVYTCRPTYRAKVVAALRHIGRPATKDEITGLLSDANPRTAANTLGSIEGVVRADKERWAFAEWVEDAYDGIPGEIDQRIDEHGGAVPLALLMEEIPRLFGVAAASVKAYAGTPAYTVDDQGLVRHAQDAEFDAIDPADVPDTELTPHGWGQVVRLTDDNVVRGFSVLVSAHVAYANSIRLGANLSVPLHVRSAISGNHRLVDGNVSIIWRPTSINGKTEVGRTASALREHGFRGGDHLLVVPTPQGVYAAYRNGVPSAEGSAVAPHHITVAVGSHEEDLPALTAKSGNAWFATAIDGRYARSGIRIPTAGNEPLPDHVTVGTSRLPLGPVPLFDEERGGYVDGEYEDFNRTRLAEGEVLIQGRRHHTRVKLTKRADGGWHLTARVYPGGDGGLIPPSAGPNRTASDDYTAVSGTGPAEVSDPLLDILRLS